jgi:nucleobase:cation symporter-1, NCS1 family
MTSILNKTEHRTIDYVPKSERHGRLLDQSTIWFAGSGEVLSFATGIIGITLGLNLAWTLIGMAVGMALSTLLVSAHASQGPHLGLPQMVQSRPQFGRYGALLIWTVAILLYWGFIVSCFNFLEVTAIQIVHVTSYWWVLPAVVLSAILAIYGYDLLHASQRYISYVLVVILAVFFIGTFVRQGFPLESLNLIGTFDAVKFMVVVSTSFAYALTWAVFVSDYSRYLPADTSHRALISWTSAGVWGGCFFMAAVGSIAAVLFPVADMIPAVQQASDRIFPGFGAILIGFGTIALISYIGMCIYGGALTLISAVDSFRPTVPSRSVRALVMVGFTATAAYVGHVLPQEFLSTGFVVALTVAGLFLAPWTAVNLVDYFVIRRAQYSITEIFNPTGIYKRWNWRGLLSYAIGFTVMLPFAVIGSYSGIVAQLLGGVDISLFVGIPLAGFVYFLLSRNLDLTQERAIIAAEAPLLDGGTTSPHNQVAQGDPAPVST